MEHHQLVQSLVINYIFVFLFGYVSTGCTPKGSTANLDKRIYPFVNWLFAQENQRSEAKSILLLSESDNSWVEDYLRNSTDMNNLEELDGLSSKRLDEVLSKEDWTYILDHSKERVEFDSLLLDSNIELISENELRALISKSSDRFIKRD